MTKTGQTLALIAVYALTFSCSTSERPAPAKQAPAQARQSPAAAAVASEPDFILTAEQLYAEHDANFEAFKDKYFLKTIQLTGIARAYQDHGMLTVLKIGDKDDPVGFIRCQFSKKPAAIPTAGQPVTVRGMMGNPLIAIRIQRCEIVKE